ncbi:hypothetical protein RINTHH_14740 [Richelia intracellularis HH01]|uniref:Uncharacterized protein n=1 Tax=Richelia intracellularis HH01 TaxID=1165094 RepID=M1WST1_9NOST|nr:hypothetical protein RINTHH_14740 [Richelia intracellularis HH01]
MVVLVLLSTDIENKEKKPSYILIILVWSKIYFEKSGSCNHLLALE